MSLEEEIEGTLVGKLRAIDTIPGFVSVDKEKEYRKLLDKYARKNPLVDRAMKGEFSFYDSVNELSKKHRGIRLFLPMFKDEKHDRRLREMRLNELFWRANDLGSEFMFTDSPRPKNNYLNVVAYVSKNIFTKLFNPIGDSLLGVPYVGYLSYSNNIGITGRLIGGAILGAILGLILPWGRSAGVNETKNDAKYLDGKIRSYRGV